MCCIRAGPSPQRRSCCTAIIPFHNIQYNPTPVRLKTTLNSISYNAPSEIAIDLRHMAQARPPEPMNSLVLPSLGFLDMFVRQSVEL